MTSETDKELLLSTAGMIAQALKFACSGGSVTFAMTDKVAERLARVLREVAEDGWRPIETAPKDGTRVLLFGPRTDGSGNYQDVGGWWRNNWRPFEDDYCAFNHPHYWRPLPSPPSETGNDH